MLRRLCRLNLSVCEDDILKTICPSRRTSRPKSHSGGLRRTSGRFARLGGMETAQGAMVCGKFAWKLAELAILNSHQSNKPSDDLSFQTICLSSSVKTAIANYETRNLKDKRVQTATL